MAQAQEGNAESMTFVEPADLGCFSLIAIMLGRLKMSVDECIKAYTSLFEKIFGRPVHKLPVNWQGKIQARFDSEVLKQCITRIVAEHAPSELESFNDGNDRGCRT